MSTSAVTASSPSPEMNQYYQTRKTDLQQLGKALGSGNVSEAQTELSNITSLGQSGPFKNGDAFYVSQREQDFTAIGQALQSGNLAGAQEAFSTLKDSFQQGMQDPPSAIPVASSSSSSSNGFSVSA